MIVTASDRIGELEISVGEFWQWAFGDLSDDDNKGWFAEWLVGKLLKIPMTRRISWANSDLIVGDRTKNLRIEVKSTAYWQSYKLCDEFGSAINPKPLRDDARRRLRFAGLTARTATNSARPSDKKVHKSDLYVFALQRHMDHQTWNALDLSQWEFFLVTKEDLLERQSITVPDLEKMGAGPMTAQQFSLRGREEIRARGFGTFVANSHSERMDNRAQSADKINANGNRLD